MSDMQGDAYDHDAENWKDQVMRARLIAGGIAAAACAVAIGATAAPAHAITDARVLAGPGDDYPVIGRLNRGAAVDASRCLPDYSWCYVISGSNYGWVYGDEVSSPYEYNPEQVTIRDLRIVR